MNTVSAHDTEALLSLFLGQLFSFQAQDTMVIGLSGGTSLLPFYTALQEHFSSIEEKIRTKIRFAFLDERLVPLDHPESNYRLLSEHLFTPLFEKSLIKKEQIFLVPTSHQSPEKEYGDTVPPIDIGLFGVGPDGHIASLFPFHPGLEDKSGPYILVHDSPKPPANRISVSVSSVQKIPSVFVFFIGEKKIGAYKQFLDPHTPEEQCPAKYILECTNYTVVTDFEI